MGYPGISWDIPALGLQGQPRQKSVTPEWMELVLHTTLDCYSCSHRASLSMVPLAWSRQSGENNVNNTYACYVVQYVLWQCVQLCNVMPPVRLLPVFSSKQRDMHIAQSCCLLPVLRNCCQLETKYWNYELKAAGLCRTMGCLFSAPGFFWMQMVCTASTVFVKFLVPHLQGWE